MISSNALKAKITRNGFIKHAGQYFRDESSGLIRALNENGHRALVGIQKSEKLYTVICEEKIYFSARNGDTGTISIGAFGRQLHENALKKGRWGRYKYIKIEGGREVWLNNISTMTSLWNLLLWLEGLENEKEAGNTSKV